MCDIVLPCVTNQQFSYTAGACTPHASLFAVATSRLPSRPAPYVSDSTCLYDPPNPFPDAAGLIALASAHAPTAPASIRFNLSYRAPGCVYSSATPSWSVAGTRLHSRKSPPLRPILKPRTPGPPLSIDVIRGAVFSTLGPLCEAGRLPVHCLARALAGCSLPPLNELALPSLIAPPGTAANSFLAPAALAPAPSSITTSTHASHVLPAYWDNCSSLNCTGDVSLMYGLTPLKWHSSADHSHRLYEAPPYR